MVLMGQFSNGFSGSIWRVIVHKDDFPMHVWQADGYAPNQFADVISFLEGRNDDRQFQGPPWCFGASDISKISQNDPPLS